MVEAVHARGLRFDRLPDRRAVESWLLSIFLALGPVSWLPGVPQGALRWAALALFLIAVGLVLGPPVRERNLQLPGGLLGVWGFAALIALSIPGLAQTSRPLVAINYLADLARNAIFLWCFYHLVRRGTDVDLILRRTFCIVAGLAGLALAKIFADLAEPALPCHRLWDQPSIAGFAAKKTHWAIGLALTLPAALLFASTRLDMKRRMALWYATVALLGAQFFSGSRNGLLASVIAVFALLAFSRSRWMGKWLIVGGLCVFAASLSSPSCVHHWKLLPVRILLGFEPSEQGKPILRLRKRIINLSRRQSLERLTTNRTGVWSLGLERLAERPLLGHGIREVTFRGIWTPTIEIHNLYLKWAIYCGVLAPLLFLAMIFAVMRRGWQLVRRVRSHAGTNRKLIGALALIAVLGFVASMFEPNVLVGNFRLSAIWWGAVGAIVGLHSLSDGRTLDAARR